jgi:hypothetical protein
LPRFLAAKSVFPRADIFPAFVADPNNVTEDYFWKVDFDVLQRTVAAGFRNGLFVVMTLRLDVQNLPFRIGGY